MTMTLVVVLLLLFVFEAVVLLYILDRLERIDRRLRLRRPRVRASDWEALDDTKRFFDELARGGDGS